MSFYIGGCSSSLGLSKSEVDSTLPTIDSIKSMSGSGQIALEWTPIYDDSIEGYQIFRGNPDSGEKELTRIAIVKNRYSSHYVDEKLKPQTNYSYAIRTYSADDRVSNLSKAVVVRTENLMDSVPFAQAIMGLPGMIKLIWRPHPNLEVTSYIIERSDMNEDDWEKIAEVKGRLNAEYLDKGLKDNRSYKYRIFVKTISGAISKPSNVLNATTKPLPPIIENVVATKDMPKKIVVKWDRSPQEDVAHYKVYSSPTSSFLFTLKTTTNANFYEDLINDNGKTVYYKVTAVDNYGLESKKQKLATMGSTLQSPATPFFTQANQDLNQIYLSWSATDSRAVKFDLTKEFDGKSTTFTNIQSTNFRDDNVMTGVEYTYKVTAVDEFGLASKQSDKVVILVK